MNKLELIAAAEKHLQKFFDEQKAFCDPYKNNFDQATSYDFRLPISNSQLHILTCPLLDVLQSLKHAATLPNYNDWLQLLVDLTLAWCHRDKIVQQFLAFETLVPRGTMHLVCKTYSLLLLAEALYGLADWYNLLGRAVSHDLKQTVFSSERSRMVSDHFSAVFNILPRVRSEYRSAADNFKKVTDTVESRTLPRELLEAHFSAILQEQTYFHAVQMGFRRIYKL